MLINQLDLLIYNPLRAELFQEEYGSVFHIPYAGLCVFSGKVRIFQVGDQISERAVIQQLRIVAYQLRDK